MQAQAYDAALLAPHTQPTRSGWAPKIVYHLVLTLEALEEMRAATVDAFCVAYDTEGSGLKPDLGARISGHALCALLEPDVLSCFYVPVRHVGVHNEIFAQLDPEIVAGVVCEILARPDGIALFHHAKFDMNMARADGITVGRKIIDIAILANVANENERSFSLKNLAEKYCIELAKAEKDALENSLKKDARELKLCYKQRSKSRPEEKTYLEQFGFSRAFIPLIARYACHDVFYTYYLYWMHYRHVRDHFPELVDREHELIPLLHDMEWRGLQANRPEIERAYKLTCEDLAHWMGVCRELTGDPDFALSPSYLSELFYQRMQLTPLKLTKEGGFSTDKEARLLLRAAYPEHADLIDAVGRAAKLEKMRSTYTGSFLDHFSTATGCIHGSYNQIERKDEGGVPVTGRLSSAAPNVQNIETKPIHLSTCECKKCVREGAPVGEERSVSVRRYFTVPGGYIRAYLDFSQIELRVLTWFCRDPSLLECYANDLDVHQMTADTVTNGDRGVAKTVNFANIYGQTGAGLAKKIPGYYEDPKGTELKGEQILAAYFRKYWGIPRFRDTFAAKMRANGNSFVNPFGRPRRIAEISSDKSWERRRAERRMMSSIISGTAADIMKISMLRCGHYLQAESPRSHMVQTIHDELIFDIYAREGGWVNILHGLKQRMEAWPMFESQGVPIRVGIKITNTNWENLQKVELDSEGRLQFAA